METTRLKSIIVIMLICVLGFLSGPSAALGKTFKVLVVMSYDKPFEWVQEIEAGIESVLSDSCEIKYVYMKTKKDPKGGPNMAKEAYALYSQWKPDGVIAADDNAQSMFVVPYLRDKVSTPVMFCGVNAEPENYNYPASNVSGILERWHIKETIAFAQQLVPSIKTVAYMHKASPSADALFKALRKEADTYPVKSVAYKTPTTLQDAIGMAEELREKADLLFITALQGIVDDTGKPLTDKEGISHVTAHFKKPTITDNSWNVRSGILCAVIKTGQEQGKTAAKMLLKAMNGTSVPDIPIVQNHNGKRMINVSSMKSLGIKPKRVVFRGTELVKTDF